MIINDGYGKKFIELTQDELIIYKKFLTYRYKRENIKTAYVDKYFSLIIVLKRGMRKFNVQKIHIEEKVLLDTLLTDLNVERNIFASTSPYFGLSWFWGLLWIIFTIDNFRRGLIFFGLIDMLIAWCYIQSYVMSVRSTEFWYNVNTKQITLRKFYRTEKFKVDDNFICEYLTTYSKVFRIKKKRSIEIGDNYLYPSYYTEELHKLCEEKKQMSNF